MVEVEEIQQNKQSSAISDTYQGSQLLESSSEDRLHVSAAEPHETSWQKS